MLHLVKASFLILLMSWASAPLFAVESCEKRAQRLPSLSPSKAWSSDYLLKVISDLDALSVGCPLSKAQIEKRNELKQVYLKRLGINSSHLSDVDELFRAFSVEQKVFPELQTKLKQLGTAPEVALDWIKGVYGMPVQVFRHVIFIGSSEEGFERLKSWITDLCPKEECVFFDEKLLYRVMLVKKPGIGAYVPELSTLLLSEELLKEDQMLNRFVLAHELAHLAIRKRRLVEGAKWDISFRALSGWTVSGKKWELQTKDVGTREDALTAQSLKSAFSILPDSVLLSSIKDKDGFAVAKSYRETVKQGSGDEDLADHLALAKVFPERFCWKGKPIAQKKYDWIRREVLPEIPLLSCH